MGKAYGQHKAGQMNGTETAYARILELQKANGTIKDWWFEAMTLKLATDCRYTPDFMVQMPDDSIEFHEIKGGIWRDDSRVKIRVAAEKYPFRFHGYTLKKKSWHEEDFTVK